MIKGNGLIKNKFWNYFNDRGYHMVSSYPLRTDDPTLFFVNATITPFKPNMIAGSYIPDTAHIQECFRAKFDTDFLFYFEMLGVTSMLSSLSKVFIDFVTFLTECCEIPMDQLLIVLHKDDNDLKKEWMMIRNDEDSIFTVEGNTDKFKTRWKYGDTALSGRGLTITLNNKQIPHCSASCNPLCECSRYLPMGNIIIVKNELNGLEYVDVGFGVEFLNGLNYSGDLFLIEEFKNVIDMIVSDGFNEADSRRLFNLIRGINKLLDEGCIPLNKGEGYILRAMTRRVINIIIENYTEKYVLDKFLNIINTLIGQNTVKTDIIKSEAEIYLHNIGKGLNSARKFITNRPDYDLKLLRSKIKETFGLPDSIISKLIENYKE